MDCRNLKVNVLGDSITDGCGVSGPDQIWHAVLAQRAGFALVRNYGIGGTRIARQTGPDLFNAYPAFVDRYQTMEDDADLVMVFGGTNDYGHGSAPFGTDADRTPETFCGACHLLFRGLAEKYPRGRVVILTPTQREGGSLPTNFPEDRPDHHTLLEYADAEIRIAAQYALPVLDLYRTSGICPDIPAQKEAFCPDGLHPNDAGAARIALRVEAFLHSL